MNDQTDSIVRRAMDRGLIIRIKIDSEIGVYKSTLRALGCPTNIHFWWSENEEVLLISAADKTTEMSISVSKYYYSQMNGLKISNRKLLQAVQILLGWENGTEKKLAGKFVPEIKMVAFKTRDTLLEVLVNA